LSHTSGNSSDHENEATNMPAARSRERSDFPHNQPLAACLRCDVLSQVLASEQLQTRWTNPKATERAESARFAGGIPFANRLRHAHGSAAVIGRESGSAQVSWDDACTAIVPTWPGWNRSRNQLTDPAQVATLKINFPKENKRHVQEFFDG
jgi:hypothetical protein